MRKLNAVPRWGVGRDSRPTEAKQKLPVLFVEDDPASRRVGVMRLDRHFDLLVAENDREACDLYRAHATRIHLILLDIQLQGSTLDGMRLCQLFRSGKCDVEIPEYARGLPVTAIPVVFMTAYGNRYGIGNLAEAGANRVMEKPIDFVRLSSVLMTIHTDILKRKFEVL